MKLWIKFALLILFLAVPKLWAQGVAPTNQQILDDEETGGRGKFYASGVAAEDSGQTQMERISENFKDVKIAHEACLTEKESGATNDKLEDCIWGKIPAKVQTQIMEYLDEEKEALKEDSKTVTAATGAFRSTQDQTTRKLQEYLKERLQKTLYDQEQEKGVKILSDHAQFYEIYKSQIGQNVIRVTSDTCMYAFENGTLPESFTNNYAIENKKRNMANLSVLSTNPKYAGKPKSYVTFNQCLSKIPSECKQGNNQACRVLSYMEEAKKGIKDIDSVQQELTDYHKDSSNQSFASIRSKEKLNNEKEIAKLTLIASGEIKEADIDEVAKDEAKLLEECALTQGKSEDCDLYLTDAESKKEIEAEFMIREKAKEEKIKLALANNMDIEAVKAVLEEEGMSEEQIARYLASKPTDGNDNIISHAEDIKKRYEEKRIAVIEELNDRIKVKQNTEDAIVIDPDNNDGNTFQELQEQAEGKTQSLEQSILFANVVSSFIEVGDEGNTNANALANELANTSFEDNSVEGTEIGLGLNHKTTLETALQGATNKAPDDELPMLEASNLEEIIYELGDEKEQ